MSKKVIFDPILNKLRQEDINFSYHTIPENTVVTIPNNQQMIVFQNINIIGELFAKGNGELVIINT